jgi:hypothetical protein
MARATVARVIQQRAALNAAGTHHKVLLTAWDHADFARRGERLDGICGMTGYAALYERYQAVPVIADALLYTCLLRSGGADGFLQHHVQVQSPRLTRGVLGVAVLSGHRRRIHSDVLILPILTPEERKAAGHVTWHRPSTRLPEQMTQFLFDTLSSDHGEVINASHFLEAWESFLYQAIAQEEPERWILLHAACTPAERSQFSAERLVAITCTLDDHHAGIGEAPNHPKCCSFYDDATDDV